ncbi:MAG: hypothetical protein JWL77_5671 [Chthonomonadaceae bacterium]|nr:hypothetical protein [Chthonomonadaceae bacterium]
MQSFREGFPIGSNRRIALVCIPIGLLIIWYTVANRTPVVSIPNPVMPKLNAFDFYVRAGNAIVGDKQITDAVSTDPTVSYSLKQKEALVRQNVGSVDVLHQGFAYPYLTPPLRSLNTELPHYKKFRLLARLLSLRGQVRAAHGDWSGAAENYLDGLRLGEDIPHGASLIGELVGIACQNTARRPLWDVVDHLNAAQTRAVMARLTDIMARHVPFTDTIQEEKWTGQAYWLEIVNGTLKTTPTKGVVLSSEENPPSESMIYLFRSKQRLIDDFTTYMDRSIAIARQPYIFRKPPPPPTDIIGISQLMTSVVPGARIKDVAGETQNGLLLVTLALHAFRLEHGHYPKALEELMPSSLPKLPDDPFAAQGTFQYKFQGKGYVLYSIGPDGKDDGGTPIDDPKSATTVDPQARYQVKEDSVGDIVAGINRP